MNILEKEIEDLVYEGLKTKPRLLELKGLKLYPNCVRQFNLGSYGIADLVCFDIKSRRKNARQVSIQIVELKKESLNKETLIQAFRYAAGVRDYVSSNFESRIEIKFEFILIGKTIQEELSFIVESLYDEIKLYTYSIDFEDGIIFNRCTDGLIANNMPAILPYISHVLKHSNFSCDFRKIEINEPY